MTVLLDIKNNEKSLNSHCVSVMICAARVSSEDVTQGHLPGHLKSISKYTYPVFLIVVLGVTFFLL